MVKMIKMRNDICVGPVRYGIIVDKRTGAWLFPFGSGTALKGKNNYELFLAVVKLMGEYRNRPSAWRRKPKGIVSFKEEEP